MTIGHRSICCCGLCLPNWDEVPNDNAHRPERTPTVTTATDTNTDLLRYLIERLIDAIDNHDSDTAVTVLRQITVLDPDLGRDLRAGLLRAGIHRLLTHITTAITDGDTEIAIAVLTQIHAIDPHAAAELTNLLLAHNG